MKRCWNDWELAEHSTLFETEAPLVANRTDRGRIDVAVLLKYVQLNGRFPRQHRDVPGAVLAFLGEQLSMPRSPGSTTTCGVVAASATVNGFGPISAFGPSS